MVLSDLIRTLSQAGQRATAPAARQASQQYKARSPWGQRVQQRQAQLMQDMRNRQQQRRIAQEQYQNQMRTYKTNRADYTEKRRALGKSDSTLYGEGALQGQMREDYIAKRLGAKPTMPTEPTTSTANVIRERYQRPERTQTTKSWRNTRSTMPTGNRRFLRGVKLE